MLLLYLLDLLANLGEHIRLLLDFLLVIIIYIEVPELLRLFLLFVHVDEVGFKRTAAKLRTYNALYCPDVLLCLNNYSFNDHPNLF
jgi:hypothetical protein